MPVLRRFVRRRPYLVRALRLLAVLDPNLRGAARNYPGDYYSPLLDIAGYDPAHDGVEMWENIDLRPDAQRDFYAAALTAPPTFARAASPERRYYTGNTWFEVADAFTLRAMLRRERPKRIIEVGSGFSSAVILDTVDELPGYRPDITFVEPNPERLRTILRPTDPPRLLAQPVQEVGLGTFEELDRGDILFIDSSHVAKAGSDVAFLLLRVLPRLRPGVLVHFHDIHYPHTLPAAWIEQGHAYNESLFVRAFLTGNPGFEVVALNPFAALTFADLIRPAFPQFYENTGGSLWLRRV